MTSALEGGIQQWLPKEPFSAVGMAVSSGSPWHRQDRRYAVIFFGGWRNLSVERTIRLLNAAKWGGQRSMRLGSSADEVVSLMNDTDLTTTEPVDTNPATSDHCGVNLHPESLLGPARALRDDSQGNLII